MIDRPPEPVQELQRIRRPVPAHPGWVAEYALERTAAGVRLRWLGIRREVELGNG